MLKSICIFFLMALSIATTSAQKKAEPIFNDTFWFQGKIIMADGSTLAGKVNYRDVTGVVSLIQGEDDTRSFRAKDIAGFSFFDSNLQRTKNFLSLEFDDPEDPLTKIFFFEVLKEFKEFAVLSKTDPLKTKVKKRQNNYDDLVGGQLVEAKQTETVYFFDAAGTINPYFQIIEKEQKDKLGKWDSSRNKYIDRGQLERHTGPHYRALVKFAEENDLSLKGKEDLLKVLNYYETLR